MNSFALNLPAIFHAAQAIRPFAVRSPLKLSLPLAEQIGTNCYLKLETSQPIRAFKIRGAANKIAGLSLKAQQRGVISVSTGNHGLAVAYVAKHMGIKAVVCLSHNVPQNKLDSLHQLGAEVVIYGQSQDDASRRATEIEQEHGYTMIHPFDDPKIIAGQGTIGLEIAQDLPDIDTVLVPLSGGGLIAGIALALKSINSGIRVIGISMERACVMYHSLQTGHPIEMPEHETLADSLLGGVGLENQHTFSIVQQYVDEVILVNEDEIAQAMGFALHEHHLVVEGAGAVGIAAIRSGKIRSRGGPIVSVISGGNVDMNLLLKIAQEYRS